MKNNLQITRSQTNKLKQAILHPWIEQDPATEIAKWTELLRKLLNQLIWMGRVWRITEPSQEYIARKLGCSREWVNKMIKHLIAEGIISSVYRHRHTSVYQVNDFFKLPHVRKKLANLLPAIVVFSLSLLQSSIGSDSSHHFIKYFILNSLTRYHSLTIPLYSPSKKETTVMKDTLPTISGLKLTKYGQIKLCPYPKEALIEAEKALAKQGIIEKPMAYVIKICKNWCQRHNVEPDWQKMYRLLEEGNFAADEKEVESILPLKASLFSHQSALEETPQRKASLPRASLHCHPICNRNYITRCVFAEIERKNQEAAENKRERELHEARKIKHTNYNEKDL